MVNILLTILFLTTMDKFEHEEIKAFLQKTQNYTTLLIAALNKNYIT